MFETQKSVNKTSSGEIGLDIRTHASPKMGQDQVSGRVSVLFWSYPSVVRRLKVTREHNHNLGQVDLTIKVKVTQITSLLDAC